MIHGDYGNNFIGKSSTKRLYAPGGQSSLGSLLGFGGGPAADENVDNSNNNTNHSEEAYHDNNNTYAAEAQHIVSSFATSKSASGLSDAEKVLQFTVAAKQRVPSKPELMDVNEVRFISKMIIDEVLELCSTLLRPKQAKDMLHELLENAKDVPRMASVSATAPAEVQAEQKCKLIAEQADAFVDVWYYSLNAMAKKGVNVSKVFNIVHDANMAKRDPKTGKFIKRSDGKIIKPQGWRAPNVELEILKQVKNGAWS